MINRLFIYLIVFLSISQIVFGQVSVTQDVLPNSNTPDSTALLNNQLRQNANAINSIGGYFNSNGYLTEANGGTGANLSAIPNGSILIQNTSNVGIGTFGQGTSGQFLQSQGAGNNPTWASGTFGFNGIQVFTSSGTWTHPAGVANVYVRMWGGGGHGGTGGSGTGGGGGGGGGGHLEGVVAVSGDVSVTVGTGGSTGSIFSTATAGDGANGGNGGGSGGTAGAGGTNTFTETPTISVSGTAGTAGTGPGGGGCAGGNAGNGGIPDLGYFSLLVAQGATGGGGASCRGAGTGSQANGLVIVQW